MATSPGYTCFVENVTGPPLHCFSSSADMAMTRGMESADGCRLRGQMTEIEQTL